MIGTLLIGRYRLAELIGTGGMANVYLARDEKEDCDVAVKVLKEEHADNRAVVERFESEGRTGKLLDHKNIVRVYDTGAEDGKRFIVMELARGVTLKEVIKQRARLDPEACIDIALQVLKALDYAHAKGIVHRDVKPHNILLQPDGNVKVYDFGIAQTIGEKKAVGEDSVMGTVYYISPEQARAERAQVRSDIYSFGITLFEMLTGTLPFTGTSVADVARMHLTEEVPAPQSVDTEIPKSLNDIVRKATRKNLRNRYRSAQEMRRDLMRARREPGGGFVRLKEERNPAGRAGKKLQPDRAKPRIYAIVGLVAVLVLATIALFVFGNVSAEEGQQVASVIGMEQSKAESKLKKQGYIPDIVVAEPDSNEPAGTVFKQEPAAGEKLVEGGIVRLYVSAGVSLVTVPDVQNMKLSDAIGVIKENGLTVGDVTQVTSDEPSTYVVQQDPVPGEDLMPNTEVDLWISGGSEASPGGSAEVTEVP